MQQPNQHPAAAFEGVFRVLLYDEQTRKEYISRYVRADNPNTVRNEMDDIIQLANEIKQATITN